jgi:cytochrome c oxidase subunit 4
MSEQAVYSEHHLGSHPDGSPDEGHPGPGVYIVVALVLGVMTAMEISVFYVQGLQSVLVPILIVLAMAKFALVAMFYMHLHYDHRVFSVLFVFPLLLAVLVVLSLLLLFAHLSTVLSFALPIWTGH